MTWDGALEADGTFDLGVSLEYAYDVENRLKYVQNRDNRVEFTYDYMGRRVRQVTFARTGAGTVDHVLTTTQDLRFMYDGWHMIAQIKAVTTTSGPTFTPQKVYVWGLDISGTRGGAGGIGGLLAWYDRTAGKMYAPCYDGRGNVQAIYGMNAGHVISEYEYDQYGKNIRTTGYVKDATTLVWGMVAYDPISNPFRYQTKWRLQDSTGINNSTGYSQFDLYDYGKRWYNPKHGRFINRDPIGEQGGLNLYAFVGNDPVNQSDMLGEYSYKVHEINITSYYYGDGGYSYDNGDYSYGGGGGGYSYGGGGYNYDGGIDPYETNSWSNAPFVSIDRNGSGNGSGSNKNSNPSSGGNNGCGFCPDSMDTNNSSVYGSGQTNPQKPSGHKNGGGTRYTETTTPPKNNTTTPSDPTNNNEVEPTTPVVNVINGASPWRVGWQCLSGTGPRSQQFTNGDPFTELLRQHSHVQDTRNIIANNIANGGKLEGANVYGLGGFAGVPKYLKDYSTLATGGLTGNLAVTYLGSYQLNWQVTGINLKNQTATVVFHITNSSTIESATHPPVIGYTSWWSNNIGQPLNGFFSSGPMSTTTQTFDWTETITWPPQN